MSFLRLLSTGKSWVGMRNQVRPYQVSEEVRLPRFERKNNPFRATTRPARPAKQPEVAPEVSESIGQTPAPTPAQTIAPTPAIARSDAATPISQPKLGSGGLVKSIRAWIDRRTARKAQSKRVAQTRPEPMQTELRLEAVTVVRNDLSDSDIEVVPKKEGGPVAATAGQEKASSAVSPQGVSGSAWGRVTARVFGPGKVG
jgi:hypothetical protein